VGLPAAVREILAGMGGKNRGRVRTALARRSTSGGRKGQVLRLPGLREVYDAVIAASADLEAAADALEAELWLAANVCAIRTEAPDDEAYHLAMLDVIDEARRDGRRQCLLLLRVMAAVGPHGLGEPAARAAGRLADRSTPTGEGGTGLPAWVDTLGETTVVGDCYVWTDVFGEYSQVYCQYQHDDGGRRHGLLVTIDLAFHGVVHGIDVVTAPKQLDRVVPDLERDTRRDGGRLERVPAVEAAGLLRQALAACADPALPSLQTAARRDDALHALLPLTQQRVTSMPGGDSTAPPPGRVTAAWPPRRRQALVDEFLTAHPEGWADPGTTRMFTARIVDASVDALGFPPDRIGLASVARLFGEVLPASVAIPQALLDQAQQVAHAWVRWHTDRLDLPHAARRQLRRATRAVLAAFPALCRDRRLNPTVPYLADTAAPTDGPTLQEILQRRGFAVPLPGQRGDAMIDLPEPANGLPSGRTHIDNLDAAEPTHRNLITAIGQATHGTPTRRVPAYIAVVEQLWNNQPTAVWQTAKRLSTAGLPRQQILDRLAAAWQRHGGHTDLPDNDVSDADVGLTDSYTAALQAIGAAPAPRGHR
jgi:hypothetical protein